MVNETQEKKYSFEEYKLYYESIEKVTDRRLAINSWNYAICTGVIAAIAALASWTLSHPDFRLVIVGVIVILAAMGVALCTPWVAQIRDYKGLNNAKFEVLIAMAPLVEFGSSDARVSANPFDREWKLLQANKAAYEDNSMKLVTLSASNAEFFVPKSFRWIFLLLIVVVMLAAVINWKVLDGSPFSLTPSSNTLPRATAIPGSSLAGKP